MTMEREEAGEILRKSEEKFRSIVQTAVDAIILADTSGNIILWNSSAQKIFGYSEDEVLGKSLTILMPERYREAHQKGLDRVHLTGETKYRGKTRVLHALRKSGNEFPIELTVSYWKSQDETFYTGIVRDITERKILEDDLRRLATTDPLTGIFNRRKMNELLAMEINRSKRYDTRLSLIMFDIDFFKKVNDTFGHSAGDYVLITMANTVNKYLRKADHFCRWGGEEFLILTPETDLQEAANLAERLRTIIEGHNFEGAGSVTISLGVTELSKEDTIDSFLVRVDDALYSAKNKGRNRVEIALPPNKGQQ